jgi:5S rRNA maturation endonuclease (ribonuclease M5)
LYKFFKSSTSSSSKNKTGGGGGRKEFQKQLLRDLLEERLDAVIENPEMKIIGRWTQSTVFYRLRPILIDNGYTEIEKKRKYITKIIKPVCEDLGYKRHELGIIAAERAQLYFDGQSFGVSFDRLKDLVKKGTDLLVIEKEGIADVLMEFANKRGIAILNSRGFLTEYAEELSELAEQEGCNIAILTDLDSSGLLISSNLPNAYRVGIDFDTLHRFGIEKEEVEEKVLKEKESDNHLKSLIEKFDRVGFTPPKPYNLEDWGKMIIYLEDRKRIEIDSVLAAVEDSGIFWNYILNELDKVFPKRDYNRSINVNNIQALPKPIEDLIAKINDMFTQLQSNERKMIIQELANKNGFVDDVELEKQKIKERLISPSVSGGIENLKETLYELIKKL